MKKTIIFDLARRPQEILIIFFNKSLILVKKKVIFENQPIKSGDSYEEVI